MKIFCIGRNYAEHAKELNNPVPKQPLVFCKPPSALMLKRQVLFHPEWTEEIHHEVELVLKICKNGKYIAEKFAHKYYDQISVGIDFTARDIQRKLKAKGHPWEIAKGFDGSGPVGRFIPLAEAGSSVDDITFSLQKNGEVVQLGNTKDLLFTFDQLIAHLSKYFILQQGDLIFTGTPEGVGKVEIGDVLEAYIGDQHLLKCKVL